MKPPSVQNQVSCFWYLPFIIQTKTNIHLLIFICIGQNTFSQNKRVLANGFVGTQGLLYTTNAIKSAEADSPSTSNKLCILYKTLKCPTEAAVSNLHKKPKYICLAYHRKGHVCVRLPPSGLWLPLPHLAKCSPHYWSIQQRGSRLGSQRRPSIHTKRAAKHSHRPHFST